MRRRCVKFGFIVLTLSHIGQWKFNMAPHGKELSEDLKKIITTLHKDGLCYKKIANSLKLSCSTVAMSVQRFNRTGSTQNRPHLGRVHMLSVIFIGFLWKTGVWVLPALLQKLKGWGVSQSVLRPYAAHCFKLVCMAVIPEKNASSKDDALCIIFRRGFVFFYRKQFAEDKQTKDMDYWNHVLWFDETKINLFGSDGVKRVWRQPGEEYKDKCVLPTVKHGGGSVMILGCMSAASTGDLQ